MRVRMLTAIGGAPSYNVGDEADLPDALARIWIAESLAEPVLADLETAVVTTQVETRHRGRKRR